MTRPTDPLVHSAPLERGWAVKMPNRADLQNELTRASAELMYALHRQRTAWAKMRLLKERYDRAPNHEFLDNERPWKLAIGDVQWWRGEVSSRANAVIALRGLLNDMP
jgi:hypothetical protein